VPSPERFDPRRTVNIDNLALEEPFVDDDEALEHAPAVGAAGDSKHWGLAAVVFGSALAIYAAVGYGIYVLYSALS